MMPGSDPMGAPSSFTARRPNASHLPSFELPPPQLTALHQKYQHPYASANATQPTPSIPTSLTSVGNLLTPPSNVSGEGLSPISGATSTSSSTNPVIPPYTPGGAYPMWPPPSSGTTPYGFQSAATPNSYLPPRGLFSPLASMIKGTNSPTASEGLPPPPNTYGEVPPYQTSLPMSAPASMASAHPGQQQTIGHAMMGGQPPVTQASPVSEQQPFVRPPPTPTYSYSSQTSSTQPSAYSYSSGPSPIQQSPISAGGPLSRMSPTNGQGPIPSLPPQGAPSPYNQQRPFSYPVSGPVLSNVSNPNGQLGLVGGMPPNMMQGFNSGHAAQIHHIYGHPQQPQPSPANDRPFKCDQCPQSFNRNHDLKRHKRIHLAVKPFPCGHCDKSFSRKDALKRHILVKGCGKAQAALDGDSAEGSISPVAKSEGMDASPVVAASA